jgi:TRAP-type C4-dicarboxylate transport system permease small subunit
MRPVCALDRAFDRLAGAIQVVLAFALLFAIVLNFINVVDRYLLGASILWADEIEIYLVLWITFLGAVVVSWRRAHLRMDVLLVSMPPWVQTSVRAAELTLLTGLCAFVAYHSLDYTSRMFRIGRASDTAGLPLWLIHGALVIGFAGMSIIALYRLITWQVERPAVRTPTEPP